MEETPEYTAGWQAGRLKLANEFHELGKQLIDTHYQFQGVPVTPKDLAAMYHMGYADCQNKAVYRLVDALHYVLRRLDSDRAESRVVRMDMLSVVREALQSYENDENKAKTTAVQAVHKIGG